MSKNFNTVENNSFEKYKKYLSTKRPELMRKYNLQHFEDCDTIDQQNFAEDVRTQFLIDYEKYSSRLSESDKEKIKNEIIYNANPNYWMGNKKQLRNYFKNINLSQVAQINVPINNNLANLNYVIFDCSDDNTLKITFSKSCNITEILKKHEFVQKSEYEWSYDLPIESVNRQKFINDVTVEIIQSGFPFKQIPYTPPEAPHDAYLKNVNGELCIDCMTTATCRAFSHLGARRIYLGSADKEKLKEVIKQFDVKIEDGVTGFEDEKR